MPSPCRAQLVLVALLLGSSAPPGRSRAEELTAQSSGSSAERASYEVSGARSAKAAADARVDQARDAYLPRLNVTARYVRLSDLTPPALFPFSIAATNAPAGTVSPATTSTGPVSIAPVLDNYALEATLLLPLTDYVLRLARGLEAARHGSKAASWEVVVAASRAHLMGRVAFYEWLRAGAAVEAAQQAVTDQRAHHGDVSSLLVQGNASRADLLRVESALSSAEATHAETHAQRVVAERRLRTLLQIDDSEPLTTSETVDAELPATQRAERDWLAEAHQHRAELHAMAASEASLRAQARLARAAYLPTLGAFASATYANPNPRYFPPRDQWNGTWAVGSSLTWNLTDIPGAHAAAAEADARGNATVAQKSALRDALTMEVVQIFQSVVAADARIVATAKQLASASEAYRVTRSLYANAVVPASSVLDAEADLARARLAWVNARIDARIFRSRLDHAAGRYQANGPEPRPQLTKK
jgi:outer membrane protein